MKKLYKQIKDILSLDVWRLFGARMPKHMAIRITSATDILTALNGGANRNGPWREETNNYYVLHTASLGSNQIIPNTGNSMALKVFINYQTGEVKTYVAKWVDQNAANLLP